MTIRYTFKDCVEGNVNVIDEWLGRQPDEVRAGFLSDFKHMAGTNKGQWPWKKTSLLRHEFSGIREFRYHAKKAGRVQYRLGAFDGPGDDEITLCSGWTHSENNATQRRAKMRALERKALVEQGEVTTVDHI